ncbi:MAG: hypothetical protein Q4D26_04355 [Clostridia bacterium]|nr:hypothetical protein [Clostridia bacterium]
MYKKIISIILLTSLTLSCNVYADDSNIKLREYFEQSDYKINWNNETKIAEFYDTNSQNKLIVDVKKDIAKSNDNIFFNRFYMENNNIYISKTLLNILEKLNTEPIYTEAKNVIDNNTNNITKDFASDKAITLVKKLYNVNAENYNINCTYYDNDTCGIMLESQEITFIITLDSINGELLDIDRTINKNDFEQRGEITGNRLDFYDKKIPEIINEFNYFGKLETLLYFVPNMNTSTVYSLLKDDKNNYYAFEFSDIDLKPVGIHIYKDFDTAINEINKMF